MTRLRASQSGNAALMVLGVALYLALIAAFMAYLHAQGQDWLAIFTDLSGARLVVALVLLAPGLLVLRLLAEAVGEFALSALSMATFKVVTLGQIGMDFGSGLRFNWLGLARAWDGALVASESLVVVTTVITWALLGAGCWFWLRA